MKTKKVFLILFLLSGFLFFVPGCKIFQGNQRSNGELITTKPHGRLAPGEIDDMSGSKNEYQNAPDQNRRHSRR
jgi:hypothetical protein